MNVNENCPLILEQSFTKNVLSNEKRVRDLGISRAIHYRTN